MPPACALLAQTIAATGIAQLSPAIRQKAIDHTLDTLGVILAGADAAETCAAEVALRAAGEGGTMPLAGLPGGLTPRAAALVHGIAAHAYELDDTGGCDHSGAVVWPAILSALALAPQPVSGERVIVAMVLGYDVGRRLLLGFGGYQAHNEIGWHSTGTCGSFAAAAAAAHVLRLDATTTAAALGLSASMAAGTWAFIHDGTMAKRLHAGHAAQAGLTAALLARSGVTGPAMIFEDMWGGFFATHGGPTCPDPAMLAGLGQDWKIAEAAVKPHASCRDVHAAIDAVARVQARGPLRPEALHRVQIRLNSFLIGMVGGRDISTLPAAQMSLPYGVAAQLCLGMAGLDAYAAEVRATPELRAMLARVEIVADETVTASWESTLRFEFIDGRVIEEPTRLPLGAPENPLPPERLRAKFDSLARRALSPERADELAEKILALTKSADARSLVQALAL